MIKEIVVTKDSLLSFIRAGMAELPPNTMVAPNLFAIRHLDRHISNNGIHPRKCVITLNHKDISMTVRGEELVK